MAQIEQELAISSLPSTTLQIMYAELLYQYKKFRLAFADLINLFFSPKKTQSYNEVLIKQSNEQIHATQIKVHTKNIYINSHTHI
jgi:hypothetical protein